MKKQSRGILLFAIVSVVLKAPTPATSFTISKIGISRSSCIKDLAAASFSKNRGCINDITSNKRFKRITPINLYIDNEEPISFQDTRKNKNEYKGLTQEEVSHRLEKYGPNSLKEAKQKTWIELWFEQFDDRLVQILLAVATLSAASSFYEALESSGDESFSSFFVEPAIILLILVLNATVGAWQQISALDSLQALKIMQPKLATVLRRNEDGRNEWIPNFDASQLVPDDYIKLKVGDRVPADANIIDLMSSSILSVDESALTGESVSVSKDIWTESDGYDSRPISEKSETIFAGTMVTKGQAIARVTKTGSSTEIGKIQELTEADTVIKTPLNEKLDVFGEQLAKLIAIICFLVWLVSIPRFDDPSFSSVFEGAIYYLKVAVALGVAAIPEGLPAVITLVLALGTRTLAKQNVIVRSLPSVETLGCVSVIATDKTGTLTSNQMTCTSLVVLESDGKTFFEHKIEGDSYEPFGEISGLANDETVIYPEGAIIDTTSICFGCNDAQLVKSSEDGTYSIIGEPTEGSLLVLGEKINLAEGDEVRNAKDCWDRQWTRIATLDFDRDRKSMSTLCQNEETGAERLLVKGAPSDLLERCLYIKLRDGKIIEINSTLREELETQIENLSSRPLRCLLLATKEASVKEYGDELQNSNLFERIESGLTIAGLVGMKDPPRASAKESIKECKDAGIRIAMITGDSKETAIAIAKELGIFTSDKYEVKAFSRDFFDRPIEEQKDQLDGGNFIFYRAEPSDKSKIVNLLQSNGEIVSMSGDGVNDAPALKQANIGIAMGSGTEVAKEASDMILVDDSFSTIVQGIETGRSIFANMQAFIDFLISCNVGEVFAVFLATIGGFPSILSAQQLLWINLITDGPPATALGWNPTEKDIMRRPPRDRDENLINQWSLVRFATIGLYIGIATVGIFASNYIENGFTLDQISSWSSCSGWASDSSMCDAFTQPSLALPQTLAMSELITLELIKALCTVSLDNSIFVIGPQTNPILCVAVLVPFLIHLGILYSGSLGLPFIAESFGVVPLSFEQWQTIFIWAAPIILIEEVLKVYNKRQRND